MASSSSSSYLNEQSYRISLLEPSAPELISSDVEPYSVMPDAWAQYAKAPGARLWQWDDDAGVRRVLFMEYRDRVWVEERDLPFGDTRYCLFLLALAHILADSSDYMAYPAWWNAVPYEERGYVLRIAHETYRRCLEFSRQYDVDLKTACSMEYLSADCVALVNKYKRQGLVMRCGKTVYAAYCARHQMVRVVDVDADTPFSASF